MIKQSQLNRKNNEFQSKEKQYNSLSKANNQTKKEQTKRQMNSNSANINQQNNSFKIAVRCRPTIRNQFYEQQGFPDQQFLFLDEQKRQIEIIDQDTPTDRGKKSEKKIFSFDKIFGPEDGQEIIYEEVGKEVVQSALDGFNGTIFAYGQTSTGKTHTMQGNQENQEERGIIPRACEQIFDFVQNNPQIECIIRISHLELYNENIRDLLDKSKKQLEIREKSDIGVFVENLTSVVVTSKEEILQKMRQSLKNRFVQSTIMNSASTRGHSIFTIFLQMYDTTNAENTLKFGVLNLVDLSGSERIIGGCSSSTIKESVTINQSLTMLGNVMQALTNPKVTHVPYRNSKLTRLLQNSLGGNSKTVMISTVGMNGRYYDETISTLRFSERSKKIKNIAKINKISKKEVIQSFREEYSSISSSRRGSSRSFSIINDEEKKINSSSDTKIKNSNFELLQKDDYENQDDQYEIL